MVDPGNHVSYQTPPSPVSYETSSSPHPRWRSPWGRGAGRRIGAPVPSLTWPMTAQVPAAVGRRAATKPRGHACSAANSPARLKVWTYRLTIWR